MSSSMTSEPLPSGEAVGQYRILSLLGSGGMGHVYLADDGKLGRKVALKILPPEFTRDRERLSRFEKEARAASALNHPAILTIHDVGRSADIFYIATEFIEGETLRDRMRRGGLKVTDVVDIGAQIASALVASHAAGIVHRDLKPENIMVRPDGFVKVLDFGLAKLANQDDTAADDTATVPRMETNIGTVLGTAHYMSPEQAKGLRVDGRSDIFSLGIVLYEMLTGHVPFEGATRSHVVVSIIEKEPHPLSRWIDAIPPELQRIVSKALAKDPEDRYQVVKDLLIDLKSFRHALELQSASFQHNLVASSPGSASGPATASSGSGMSSAEYLITGVRRHRKAVLASAALVVAAVVAALTLPAMFGTAEGGSVRIPIAVADFDNQTGEKDLDGLSGMLITSLEQSKLLAVMTRSRMFDVLRQRGKGDVLRIDENLGREIAGAANLQALVSVSVQKFGELYILDLKVLDPVKNEYIFATKEEGRGKEELPRMIDRLSEKMRLGLKDKAAEVEASRGIGTVTTQNMEAYQHYFNGEQLVNALEFSKASNEFRRATELDPTFAVAHYRLAYAVAWSGSGSAKESIEKAVAHIDRAPEKEKLYIRAEEAALNDEVDRAIALYRQIAQQYPGEKEAIFNAGDLAHHECDYEVAETYIRRAIELDPLFVRAHQHLTWNYRNQARYAEMLVAAKAYVERTHTADSYLNLVDAYGYNLDRANLEATLEEGRKRFPDAVELASWEVYLRNDDAPLQRLLASEEDARGRALIYELLADWESHRGRFTAAIRWYDMALTTARKAGREELVPPLLVGRALSLSHLGRLDEARANVAEAFRERKHLTSASDAQLLEIWLLARNPEGLRALTEQNRNKRVRLVVDGFAAEIAGDKTTAVARLEAAQVMQPNGKRIWMHLARLYLEMGQPDSAARAIAQLKDVIPDPLVLSTEAAILEAKGNKIGAREKLTQALEIWKGADEEQADVRAARARMARLRG
jgi:serine/threonine protein kinase/tetratricopeptide (TPR) repeat protein